MIGVVNWRKSYTKCLDQKPNKKATKAHLQRWLDRARRIFQILSDISERLVDRDKWRILAEACKIP